MCARTFRVFIFLLAPRKDGERPKGHGADCGKTLYRATLERLMGPEKGMAPACHGGGSGGSYDLPRRYPAENYPHCDALKR